MLPCSVHGAGDVGGVVSKGLPAVSVLAVMERVDGHLGSRRNVLDQDPELLVHLSSVRLDGQSHAPSFHPEPRNRTSVSGLSDQSISS